MTRQRALCDVCWQEAVRRFRLDRENKTRHEHYREILMETGSHDDGHPEQREASQDDILEIPLPEGADYPDYVLVRQAGHARVYGYPPGDDVGRLLLGLRDALEWCAQVGSFVGQDIDGGDFEREMVDRGILVEVPASEAYRREFEVETRLALAWKRDA